VQQLSKNRRFGFVKIIPWKPSFQFSKFNVGSVFRKPKTKIFNEFRTSPTLKGKGHSGMITQGQSSTKTEQS